MAEEQCRKYFQAYKRSCGALKKDLYMKGHIRREHHIFADYIDALNTFVSTRPDSVGDLRKHMSILSEIIANLRPCADNRNKFQTYCIPKERSGDNATKKHEHAVKLYLHSKENLLSNKKQIRDQLRLDYESKYESKESKEDEEKKETILETFETDSEEEREEEKEDLRPIQNLEEKMSHLNVNVDLRENDSAILDDMIMQESNNHNRQRFDEVLRKLESLSPVLAVDVRLQKDESMVHIGYYRSVATKQSPQMKIYDLEYILENIFTSPMHAESFLVFMGVWSLFTLHNIDYGAHSLSRQIHTMGKIRNSPWLGMLCDMTAGSAILMELLINPPSDKMLRNLELFAELDPTVFTLATILAKEGYNMEPFTFFGSSIVNMAENLTDDQYKYFCYQLVKVVRSFVVRAESVDITSMSDKVKKTITLLNHVVRSGRDLTLKDPPVKQQLSTQNSFQGFGVFKGWGLGFELPFILLGNPDGSTGFPVYFEKFQVSGGVFNGGPAEFQRKTRPVSQTFLSLTKNGISPRIESFIYFV